jgi:hypothetical protein
MLIYGQYSHCTATHSIKQGSAHQLLVKVKSKKVRVGRRKAEIREGAVAKKFMR